MHDDARRRRKEYEGKDKEPQSKAAAKVFQILAAAFCRARGASDTDLKAAFGRLKRKDRRNSRKLLGAESRVPKVKQTQSFRANTVKRTPIFPKNGGTGSPATEGWRQDLNTSGELMETKSGRKVAKQRYQYFLGYLKKEGKELKKEKLATQVKAYIARQMKADTPRTPAGRTAASNRRKDAERSTEGAQQVLGGTNPGRGGIEGRGYRSDGYRQGSEEDWSVAASENDAGSACGNMLSSREPGGDNARKVGRQHVDSVDETAQNEGTGRHGRSDDLRRTFFVNDEEFSVEIEGRRAIIRSEESARANEETFERRVSSALFQKGGK
jgi:hypothetical protein